MIYTVQQDVYRNSICIATHTHKYTRPPIMYIQLYLDASHAHPAQTPPLMHSHTQSTDTHIMYNAHHTRAHIYVL